jgi:hypothetical protein
VQPVKSAPPGIGTVYAGDTAITGTGAPGAAITVFFTDAHAVPNIIVDA